MATALGQVARAVFGVLLLCNMLFTAGFCKLLQVLPLSKAWRQGLALMSTQLGWRIAIFSAPWMSFSAHVENAANWEAFLEDQAADDEKAAQGKARQPPFIISNHLSFLDTLLSVAVMPARVVWRTRTYMASHLFGLPVLSTICKTIGHYPVTFTKSAYGVFEVDKEKMAIEQAKVDVHLKAGGTLAFFPEGQMNKHPDTLCTFRYGGFKKAIDFDSRLWCMVFYGNQEAWPAKEQLGGFPAHGSYHFKPLAPKGCRALVAELRKSKQIGEEQSDQQVLAEHAHEAMQAQYDGLVPKSKSN